MLRLYGLHSIGVAPLNSTFASNTLKRANQRNHTIAIYHSHTIPPTFSASPHIAFSTHFREFSSSAPSSSRWHRPRASSSNNNNHPINNSKQNSHRNTGKYQSHRTASSVQEYQQQSQHKPPPFTTGTYSLVRSTATAHGLSYDKRVGAKSLQPRSELDRKPKIPVLNTLSQLVDLADGKNSSIPTVTPQRVPATLLASVQDDLLAAFDPTGKTKSNTEDGTLEDFLEGREVVVDRKGTNFSVDGSTFAISERGGFDLEQHRDSILTDLDPTKQGRALEKLEAARQASVQQGLTNLLTVAAEYHSDSIIRRDELLARTASSPLLAIRKLPTVSASDPSSSHLKSRELRQLESVFEVLEARGFPRTIHHSLMLSALGREGFVADVEKRFREMIESKNDKAPYKYGSFFPDTIACNTVLGVYSSVSQRFHQSYEERLHTLEKARGIFRTMTEHGIKKDVVTYTTMMHLLGTHLRLSPVTTFASAPNSCMKEILELFEFMQTPRGGSLKPNRRTFSVVLQALAQTGDQESSRAMIENMMRTYEIFPSIGMMNGLLKATAYGCGRYVSLPAADGSSSSSSPPSCDVEPIKNLISLMKRLHIEPTEHSVASVIKGLAEAGQVQTAKELVR